MTLKKGFLRPSKTFIKREHISTGVILGTAFAFSLYSLFYWLREIMRLLTNYLGGNILLELTPIENFIYNLFYASIASIVGYYIFIKYGLETSRNHLDKKIKITQRHILTQYAFFIWSFLFVFGKIVGLIGIWFIEIPFQFEVDFLKEFSILFYLLPLVLFLDIWPTILKATGKKGYKWMLFSFFYITTLSVLMASINFYDYQKVNYKLKMTDIYIRYGIDVPASYSHEQIRRLALISDLYVVKDSANPKHPVLLWNNLENKIQLNDINQLVNEEKGKIWDPDRENLTINLHIDKSFKLKYVNEVKNELRKSNVRKIQYSTSSIYSKFPPYYPQIKISGLPQSLSPVYSPKFAAFLDSAENPDFNHYAIRLPKSALYRINDYKNFNRVLLTLDKKKAFLNGKSVTDEQLKNFLYPFIKKYQNNCAIIFEPDEEITYSRYIHYLDIIYSVIDKLRNERSIELTGSTYDPTRYYYSFDKIDYFKNLYPHNIIEWSPEEKRLMKLMERAKEKR